MSSWGSHNTKILFFTNYLCRSSIDFLGPIGERYAGLYYSFMERFRFNYDFCWHTGDDGQTFEYQADLNTLRPLPLSRNAKSSFSFVRLLLSFCIGNYKSRKIVVIFTRIFPKASYSPSYSLC